MQALPSAVDAVIIGGGPVGCAAALLLAQQGAQTLLLEANPRASRRLAGEWLHPPAMHVLQRLGIDLDDIATDGYKARGFVILPDDDTAPITLVYPNDATGFGCEHSKLVARLRVAAADDPRVVFATGARATEVDGQSLIVEQKGRVGETRVTAGMIVGAYGRARFDGPESRQVGYTVLSRMAGLVLEDAISPFEGFGLVVLGGPGPMLIYRLDDRRIRVCADVPLAYTGRQQLIHLLCHAYVQRLPAALQPAFRAALQERGPAWAANSHQLRRHYGRPGFALVGDAVGHFHPLSANGMTLGFLDAECLAHSTDFSAYRRERRKQSLVPELLSMALYDVFTREDPGTVALKRATYRLWRENPREGEQTLRLLAVDDTKPVHFSRSFLKVMKLATSQVAQNAAAQRQWGHTARIALDFGDWLRWLAVNTVPRVIGDAGHGALATVR